MIAKAHKATRFGHNALHSTFTKLIAASSLSSGELRSSSLLPRALPAELPFGWRSRRTERLRLLCRVHDYFVAAIDLRKSVTLYEKNASPIPPTIAKLRHTASNPPPR